MGLIRSVVEAAISSATGVIMDQWKEYFYCDAMDKDVLVKRGIKRTAGNANKGNDNIITNGSGIAVADGQCMIIVEQGKIVEVCAEPGVFTYDTSSEPSIFSGNLGDGIKATFELIGKRFTYGGATGNDQRVYYMNTKEIIDNKFGTANPIPFRVVDSKIGLDREVDLRVSGIYSYRICDPLLFYVNVCGNVQREYRREEIDSQLKTEFVNALAPALGKLSDMELRPSQLASHYTEITQAVNDQLTQEWVQKRGLKVISVALNPITLSAEDSEKIKAAQDAAVYSNPAMAAATISQATAEAMKAAAANEGGAMHGFVGMGMTMNTGGNMASGLFQQAAQQQGAQMAQQPAAGVGVAPTAGVGVAPTAMDPAVAVGVAAGVAPQTAGVAGGVAPAAPTATATPAPAPAAPAATEAPADAAGEAIQWACPECGAINNSNFCVNCGTKRPAIAKCSGCGYLPEDQGNLPNFCPNCGKKFGE